MDLPPDQGGTLEDGLESLLAACVVAVPSCRAVSLALPPDGAPTVTCGSAGPLLGSLHVRLPGGAVLLLQGSRAGAFKLSRQVLRELLDLDPARIETDAHLDPVQERVGHPDVERAVGFLLDRGLPPEQARAWLVQQAEQTASSLDAAARALLADPPERTR